MRMNPRERALMAINHECPDRVPVDLWAEPQVWSRMLNDMRLKTRDDLLNFLNVDVRYVEPVYPADTFENGIRQNMWGERWAMASTAMGDEWEHINGALENAGSLDDLKSFPWPNCDQVDYSTIALQCEQNEGYAIAFGSADIFERPALVRGLENMLCDTVVNREWVDFMIKVFLGFFVEDFTRCLEASKGRIDIYYALTDLGTQRGLLVSKETFDRFIAPSLRKLSGLAHSHGVKFMFHSCGAIRDIIPDIIKTGVDILNPIQPAAAGMEPKALKKDFGNEVCFHGGIDVQYLLPLDTPSKVSAETRRCMEILGENGGYIMAPSHCLQSDISTENIMAMYDVAIRN